MDCLRPILVRNPVFKSKRWFVDSEYRALHANEDEFVERPCGKCLNCMKRRQNEWAFRIQSETRKYPCRSFFVTLTLDDDHLHNWYHIQLPDKIVEFRRQYKRTEEYIYWQMYEDNRKNYLKQLRKSHKIAVHKDTIRIYTSAPSIDKKDLQDYFKRLRKSGLRFSYFCCGEYGDKFCRSHYHCLFFVEDQDFTIDEFKARIFPYWKMCSEDAFDVQSANSTYSGIPVSKYVAKYSVKRVGFDYKDCLPPFALMSKARPIGSSYLTADNYRQLRENSSLLVYDMQGTPYQLPRFYRNKIFSESERKFLSDSFLFQREQRELLKARLLGIDVDLFRKRQLQHNRYLEHSYFDKLRVARFGYDFEICSKTETL